MQNKKKRGRSLLKTYSFSMYKKFHPLFGKYTIPRSNSDLDSICNSCDVLYHIKYSALASKKAFHSLIPFSKYAYQSIVWAVWLNPCSPSTHTNQRKERASGGRYHQNPDSGQQPSPWSVKANFLWRLHTDKWIAHLNLFAGGYFVVV